MRTLVLSVMAFLTAITVAQASNKSDRLAEARRLFAERAYDLAGINKAKDAAQIYAHLAQESQDPKERARYQVGEAEALYFVGSASEDKKAKGEKHWRGYEVAGAAMAALGVTDVTNVDMVTLKATLSPAELELLGAGLYFRAINLDQWGAVAGVIQSLNRWSEVRNTMTLINALGLQSIYEYGASRTLGRGYYKIPSMLGGDMDKAREFLKVAFESTVGPKGEYSTNGYNNLFYAEVLLEEGEKEFALEILRAFAQADPNTLNPENVPEIERAQAEAKAILAKWE